MAGTNYTISFSMADQMQLAAGFNAAVLPLMRQAVQAIAEQASIDWQESVRRAKLWSGEKDAYAQSISWKMTGDFTARVEADYAKAGEIETGRPAVDLKRMLDTSDKVRRTKDGRRFLVIPMRHNTPGNAAHARPMPALVHALAGGMSKSSVTGMGKRLSGEVTDLHPKTGMSRAADQTPFLSSLKTQKDAMVASRRYAWGDRLTAGQLRAAGASKAEAKRYAGMVHMETSTPGGSKSSAYMTFRIMMDGQTGKWIIPAKPGLFLARKVATDLQPRAEAAFAEAVRRTISG